MVRSSCNFTNASTQRGPDPPNSCACAVNKLPTTLLGTREERLRAFSWAFFEPDRDLTPFAFGIHNSQCDFVLRCCGCRRDLACNVLCSSYRFSPGFDNNIANHYSLFFSWTAAVTRAPFTSPASLCCLRSS